MKIQYSNKATPLIIIDDFLLSAHAKTILEECIELKRLFHQAGVLHEKEGSIINKGIRQNLAIHIDQVYRNCPENSDILKRLIKEGIFKQQNIWAKDHTGFEIISQCTRTECVLSRYGDEDFYDFHRDYNFVCGQRVITLVYYIQKTPCKFTGGELEFRGDNENFMIEPKHNRLVVFNSGAYHRVNKTEVVSGKFEDGRFSVNIWMGFQWQK